MAELDRRARRAVPASVQVAGILGGVAVVLGFFALLGYCLQRGLDLDPMLQAINGPFGLVAAIGIVVTTFQNGRHDRRLGQVEALAGREGPSVVRAQVGHVDEAVAAVAEDVAGLKRVLEQALYEIGQAAVPQQRSTRRADTGVQPVVRDIPHEEQQWLPVPVTEPVLEPTLSETGELQTYLTAIPPSPEAVPLPQDALQRGLAQYWALQRELDEQRREPPEPT